MSLYPKFMKTLSFWYENHWWVNLQCTSHRGATITLSPFFVQACQYMKYIKNNTVVFFPDLLKKLNKIRFFYMLTSVCHFFFFKTVFIICHIFLNLLYNTCTSRQSYLLVRADFTRQNAVGFIFISPVSEYDYQINS